MTVNESRGRKWEYHLGALDTTLEYLIILYINRSKDFKKQHGNLSRLKKYWLKFNAQAILKKKLWTTNIGDDPFFCKLEKNYISKILH